jgi:Fic-DOC domain mobile mystery protein B
MKIPLEYAIGATPLDPNEIDGLIPSDINSQNQLNAAEQQNIVSAYEWALNKKHVNILSETFIRELHQKMFESVWRWAGKYRKSDKSIGVAWINIPEEIQKLVADVNYWLQNKTYDWNELGARFHHRLVSVHPFPNGNGRHARLITDKLLHHNQQKQFTWGAKSIKDGLLSESRLRNKYISALRLADEKNMKALIEFVRS